MLQKQAYSALPLRILLVGLADGLFVRHPHIADSSFDRRRSVTGLALAGWLVDCVCFTNQGPSFT
jgi:hypothetical protein